MARKILLADDSVTAQNMGRKILADAGYEVTTVNNGSAALKRVNELKPDLIVLDVYMPGYSGLEVCQRLKDASETAQIPVLLTVGKLEPFKSEEARRVKANAHIVKPFEASELLTAMKRLEDLLVSQPGEIGSQAPAPEHGGNPEPGSGTETGGKSKVGFASKAKKEKKQTFAAGTYRVFSDKHQASNPVSSEPEVSPAQPASQSGLQDVPSEVAPAESNALSAAASRLEASASSEAVAPKADAKPAAMSSSELPAATPNVAASHADEPVAAVPVAAPPTPEMRAFAVESYSESQAQGQPAEGAAVVPGPPAVDRPAENPPAATSAAAVASTENVALHVQEPACVDRNDEPMFATAASVIPPVADDPAPSDTELFKALELLTPASSHADASTGPAPTAAGPSARETSTATSGLQWFAKPVALSPEEAATSLETEMFHTLESANAAATFNSSSHPQPVEAAASGQSASEKIDAHVPPAKTVADAGELALKAMAASAAEGSAADATTIATLVDSVLADLRPKIVEEIAKKLARK